MSSRLLSRTLGYTTDTRRAMRDEPEPVDDDALVASRRSATRTEHARFDALLEQRRELPELDRLRLVLDAAARRGVDVTRELRVIRLRLDAMERRTYRPADRATEA